MKTRAIQQRVVSAALTVGVMLLAGCGSGYHYTTTSTSPAVPPIVRVSPSTKIYSLDATNGTLLEYTADASGSAAPSGTLTLPAGLTPLLLATDSAGQVYIAGYTTNVNTTEVLVYPSGATGPTAPTRTIQLQVGKVTALTVDEAGQIYAGQLNVAGAVNVYAASASGPSTAVRTIASSDLLYINDIAVDPSGNVYVSAYNGGAYVIDTFSLTESGTTAPLRTLYAPAGSYFGGITVDSSGTIYAMEQLTIVEIAAGSSGTPLPVQSINLPGLDAPYTAESYSNVLRRDSAGNFFVPMVMSNGSASLNFIYAFAPTATGNATPILNFTPVGATLTAPLGVNIPIGIF